ncbi:hypothetical protein SO802_010627 [Lithocarpus litseifolius]|uniref:Replication protein A subunit n=1 Tax=Lithocarpus litseifolius TaxID=425828 RepID=A0AAW2DIK0_9ROSI
MAMCWTPLSKLSMDRDNWTIKVRVLRMWDAINTKNNEFISLDMIFIDEEGSTIHAIVRKNQARTFRPQLLEGRVYTIKNFRVESTKGEFRPVHNDIKIWFMTITTIMESNEDMNSIQKYCFEFADYDQIQNQCYNYTYLIDVVGKLVAVGNVEEPQVNGAPRKLRNLQLLLKEGKEIRLSLWGTSVWQIDEDVYKNNQGPFVLIATSTIVKSFGGKFSLSSTSATKIYLNLEIPEVAEIIDRNGKKHDPTQEIPKIHAKQFSEEDFSSNNMKTIPELKCIEWDPAKQDVNCNCVATISNIDTTMGWYYISCVLCGKKVKPQSGSFWCAKCETNTNLPIPRYRIQIEVFDSTDKTTFVIFDRDAEKILNKSAKDLAEKQTEIPMQNLSDNKSASTNFVRSSQESSSVISSMINTNDATKGTNDATKGENDKSSQIEQIRIDQTSNVEDEETNDDNIPLNMLYKRRHTSKNKAFKKQKNKISQ